MGVVYRARHLALDRDRALKLISPVLSADPKFRERFARESRLAAAIEHANVIPVHHAGEEDGVLYLSMRLVEGSDLRRAVAAEGRLPPGRVAELIVGVAAGLDAAHVRRMVHRDVKPGNVLLEPGDGRERVFLTDFGISRLAASGPTVTSEGEFLGSPDYVAPEQIEGRAVDHRADVYSLGGLVYFALTGLPPFVRENDLAKLYAHVNAPRPKPSQVAPDLPGAVDEVVARAMAVRKNDRYGSAGELAAELAEVAGTGAPARTRTDAPAEAPTRRMFRPARPRLPALLAAVLALAVAGVVAAVVIAGSSSDESPTAPQPRAVASVEVGRSPKGLSIGPALLWVASRDAGAVYGINPGTLRQARPPQPTGGAPVSVVTAFDSVWVVNEGSNSIVRLNPLEGSPPIRIPVGTDPSDIAADKRWIWVANRGDDTMSRVDPTTNQVHAAAHVGDAPSSVAAGGGAVWVANTDGGSVSRVDPDTAHVVGKPIAVGQRPIDVAVGFGRLWVANVFNGTVTRIAPKSMRPVGLPIQVGDRPLAVKTGLGYVWVANSGDDTVTRIDPRSATPAGPPIPVGKEPADITVGANAIWTANFDSGSVTKISP